MMKYLRTLAGAGFENKVRCQTALCHQNMPIAQLLLKLSVD